MSLKNVPGFKYDEDTGKYVTVPFDFNKLIEKELGLPDSRSSSCWKLPVNKSSTRSEPKLEPRQPAKYRRLESGIRKELFKVPSILPQPKPRKTMRKSLKELPIEDTHSKVEVKKETVTRTPKLRRVTEEEEGLRTIPTTPKMNTEKENQKTPVLETTIDEFEKLEMLYKTPKVSDAKDTESPMSNVCNLFQKNMLLENKDSSKTDLVDELQRIIKEDDALWEQIQELQMKHRHNLRLIKSLTLQLLDTTTDADDKNEENGSRRRSLRLKKKSPKSKPAGSPVILKSGDLRKSTLNKSLATKVQKYQGENSRIQKALDMYNTTKQTCSVLLTPKLARSGKCVFSSSKSTDTLIHLSMKVQEQCMSLQDSPNVSK